MICRGTEYVFARSSTALSAWLLSGSGPPFLAATYISRPNFAFTRLVLWSFCAFFSLMLFYFLPILSSFFKSVFFYLIYFIFFSLMLFHFLPMLSSSFKSVFFYII